MRGHRDVEAYTTMFSYYGFRFVQLSNWPSVPSEDDFEALFVHSDVEQTGEFNTNSVQFNQFSTATATRR